MSHPAAHSFDEEPLELKPRPRRPFELSSDPPTPTNDSPNANTFPPSMDFKEGSTPSRNRSFLNLTSSTLFGIYSPSDLGTDTTSATPIGDGTQTPVDRRSFDFTRSDKSRNALPSAAFTKTSNGKITRRDTNSRPRPLTRKKTFTNFVLPTTARLATLFVVGGLYGSLISHLHDAQHLAPTAVALDRQNWPYYIVWGLIAVVLGEALPWADMLWAEDDDEDVMEDETNANATRGRRRDSWLDAVRSLGLFVGIAFAIRKLPWQSTLQLSLTLALTGPAVWYLIDRSPPAFLLSSVVALGGTVLTLAINPSLLPSPNPRELLEGVLRNGTTRGDDLVLGVFRTDSVGVATWIASVLFVSAVCFGNVGRRLASKREV
ncbi:uncharacterized protein RCC_04327 [Ramularia collo-cygni]|uniref:INSIG domain protein n=1 Tax=Ramularia collo-cygni TaxID=112498 RepID=A0A2D3UPK8_9PEZI|nr:uncharacterized protein RCC_04327 [Ramularia collo-cygni]CZT18482.1 uncharacterized protein RCC_04327 [Ramularia collo-cygni]